MTDETTTPATPNVPDPVTAEPAPPPAAAPAKQASKLRVAIPLVVIAGFLGFVLWSVRDNQSADDLAIGTCFDVPAESSVSTVTRHACTEAHDAEVFHTGTFPESDSYPITLTVNRVANETCGPVFQTYVGAAVEDTDELDYGVFYPSRDGWDDGDRTLTCYAHRVDDAKLTQSVKGSAGS